jgi:hypothetical protein
MTTIYREEQSNIMRSVDLRDLRDIWKVTEIVIGPREGSEAKACI